ncbi:hypothetical protein Pcinc_008660 [Petrolisthes cinctipes]|uniref:Uncharacterized protein n=1 Tax=Petrolisthes cinctipes TaxID=88211 RepID=A0AAE1G8H2_PETCI|nr:hypothetical protein Pcinc_008660 [Petrolisthes cinctipes]
MRELLNMAKGTPGDAGGLRGLLSLDRHPDLLSVFQSGSIEDDYEVEKEPIASSNQFLSSPRETIPCTKHNDKLNKITKQLTASHGNNQGGH